MPARKKQSGKGLGVADVARFIKDQKLISKGLGLVPNAGAQLAGQIAGLVGLGRKRKPARGSARSSVRMQRGGGIFTDIGGGLGNAFGGLGMGLGAGLHGLFGSGRKRKAVRPHAIHI